jgi:hypothetical protein
MWLKFVPIDQLKEAPDQPSSRQDPRRRSKVMKKLEEDRIQAPIPVNESYVILDGHGRWDAMKRLGATHVWVAVVEDRKDVSSRVAAIKDFAALNTSSTVSPHDHWCQYAETPTSLRPRILDSIAHVKTRNDIVKLYSIMPQTEADELGKTSNKSPDIVNYVRRAKSVLEREELNTLSELQIFRWILKYPKTTKLILNLEGKATKGEIVDLFNRIHDDISPSARYSVSRQKKSKNE